MGQQQEGHLQIGILLSDAIQWSQHFLLAKSIQLLSGLQNKINRNRGTASLLRPVL